MQTIQAAKLFLRCLIVVSGLLLLAWCGGQLFIELMLPLYKWCLAGLLPADYTLSDVIQISGERQQVIKMLISLNEATLFNGQLITKGTTITSSTLSGHSYQVPLIAMGCVLLWPNIPVKPRLVMLVMVFCLAIPVSLLDIPFVLMGAFTDLILFTHNPQQQPQHLYISWMRLMDDGGRLALGCTLGVVVIALWQWLLKTRCISSSH